MRCVAAAGRAEVACAEVAGAEVAGAEVARAESHGETLSVKLAVQNVFQSFEILNETKPIIT